MPGLVYVTCAERHRAWLPAVEDRWRAYLGIDELIDEPAALVFYSREASRR
jgi:hypothetical protein